MGTLRRLALTALPKFALSRTTGMLTRIPIPTSMRRGLYGWFARRYGANLDEMAGELQEFRSFATFFRRALADGARPIAAAPLVFPCDGKTITTGPIRGDRIEQIKGRDYTVAQLLRDAEYAKQFVDGYQLTIYLAPGDYHRVHSPFAARLHSVTHIPGALFPVNPGAVASIPDLFPRNERVVFRCELPDGSPAVVIMVSALNVGDTLVTASPDQDLAPGDELGQFGFGSTAIVLTSASGPRIGELAGDTVVRLGEALPPA